jgi:subtilisin family serine protease
MAVHARRVAILIFLMEALAAPLSAQMHDCSTLPPAPVLKDDFVPAGLVHIEVLANDHDPTAARPARVVVAFDDTVDAAAVGRDIVAAHGGRMRHMFSHVLNGFSAELPPAALDALSRNPHVRYVEPVVSMVPSGVQAGADWGLDHIDSKPPGFDGRYVYPGSGAGVNVYILDTGAQPHPDFDVLPAFDVITNDDADAVTDCHNHGTAVAGIIGGRTYGVAKGVTMRSINVVQCLWQPGSSSRPGTWAMNTSSDWVVAGMDWLASYAVKPAVANLCMVTAHSLNRALDDAARRLVASGVTLVVSAGNDNDFDMDSSPRILEAITVGACDDHDRRVANTAQGSFVDLFAPGLSVKTASTDGGWQYFSYTSSAAPFVTGLAALYLEKHPAAKPADVQAWIVSNASAGVVTNINPYLGTPTRFVFVPPIIP